MPEALVPEALVPVPSAQESTAGVGEAAVAVVAEVGAAVVAEVDPSLAWFYALPALHK